MKRLLLFLALLLTLGTVRAQVVKISTRDVLPNYGIDTAFVDDTSTFVVHLMSMEGDYNELQETCRQWVLKIQKTVMELTTDYPRKDSVIWIDSSICIVDWNRYEPKLHDLIAVARHYKNYYAAREQERIAEEERLLKEKAEIEARQRQQLLEIQVSQMIEGVDQRHRRIINECRTDGIHDKARVKELKDIYYAYLTVYNQYDLAQRKFTDDHVRQLQELSDFQMHLLDSVLGFGAYNARIENFKNELRLACGERHADIYKSYCKVFKRTQVPITFSNIDEYHQYIKSVYEVKSVQDDYLSVIALRDSIRMTGDSIVVLAGKNHRDVATAYQSSQDAALQTPGFTTHREGEYFLSRMRLFRQVQRQYFTSIDLRNEIMRHGAIIYKAKGVPRSLVNYYKTMEELSPLSPDFSTPQGGEEHIKVLRGFRALQDTFIVTIARNDTIEQSAKRIKLIGKSCVNISRAYNKLSKEAFDIQPQILNNADLEKYINQQKAFMRLQRQFLIILNNNDRRSDIEQRLKGVRESDKIRLIIFS